jgi:hypothetical protein
MDEWVFKEKIVRFIKSWPIFVLVFVGTGVFAALAVYFFPPVQIATAELYIGIDLTRVYDVASLARYSKTEPFNITDYKNWQLSQVQAISTSEEIATQVLSELRKQDPYWDEISAPEFMKMEELDWYDVGVWRLRIRADNESHSLHGVEVWYDTVFQELSRLIKESEDVLVIEGQKRAADDAIIDNKIQLKQLSELVEMIDGNITDLNGMDSEQVMADKTRNDIWDLVRQNTMDVPVWNQLLSNYPPSGQTISTYLIWLDKTLVQIDSETEKISSIIDILEDDKDLQTEDYIREIKEAEGLSASLYIEDHISEPFLESYYPTSVIGIIAAFTGLLIYIILWVMFFEVKVDKE